MINQTDCRKCIIQSILSDKDFTTDRQFCTLLHKYDYFVDWSIYDHAKGEAKLYLPLAYHATMCRNRLHIKKPNNEAGGGHSSILNTPLIWLGSLFCMTVPRHQVEIFSQTITNQMQIKKLALYFKTTLKKKNWWFFYNHYISCFRRAIYQTRRP